MSKDRQPIVTTTPDGKYILNPICPECGSETYVTSRYRYQIIVEGRDDEETAPYNYAEIRRCDNSHGGRGPLARRVVISDELLKNVIGEDLNAYEWSVPQYIPADEYG